MTKEALAERPHSGECAYTAHRRLVRQNEDFVSPLWLSVFFLLLTLPLMAENLRIGIIGLDTSHAEQFTLRLNDTANPNHVPGGRVVAAFPTPSADIEESRSRVEGFTAIVRDKFGVRIASGIEDVCKNVDAILLLTLDGRPRLEQMKQILSFGKPVFMDKPVAASLKDAVEIADGIVFITPEYNRSIPGVLKNAIDWASRPYGKNSFKGKMVAVLGASPGNVGTFGAQNHLDAILSYLEAMTMAQPETYLKVGDAFDAQGELTDPKLREILQLFWASFMTWIERHDAAGNGTHARHMGETPSAPLS